MTEERRGTLFVIDLIGCRNLPMSASQLRWLVAYAVQDAGMETAEEVAGDFPQAEWLDDHGSSCMALIVPLRESHLALHTWPGRDNEVWIDFCTCGDRDRAYQAAMRLADAFMPKKILAMYEVPRGLRID